jgi:2TM domain
MHHFSRESIMQDTVNFESAKRHVERKLGFLVHFTVYAVVNSGLMLLALLQQRDTIWSFAPLFGWGIGLLFHGLAVFLHAPGATWKQRMIDNELNKLNKH